MAEMEPMVSSKNYNMLLERALKAEKSYVGLRKEVAVERFKNDLNVAEHEYRSKLQIYSSLPDQMRRIENDFKQESLRLMDRIMQAEKIYELCAKGLDDGLTMEDLPLSTESAIDVEKIISAKVAERNMAANAYNRSELLGTIGQGYSMLNEAAVPGVMNYGEVANGGAAPGVMNYGEVANSERSTDFYANYPLEDGMFSYHTASAGELKQWRTEGAQVGLFGNNYASNSQQVNEGSSLSPSTISVGGSVSASSALSPAMGSQADMNSQATSARVPTQDNGKVTSRQVRTENVEFPMKINGVANNTDSPDENSKVKSTASTAPVSYAASTRLTLSDKLAMDSRDVSAINWSSEPHRSILIELSKKHKKMTTKAIKETFEKAALDIDVNDVNVICMETERKIALILKPEQHAPTTSPVKQPAIIQIPSKIDRTKTVLCMHWSNDAYCPIGQHCTFAHGEGELRTLQHVAPPAPTPRSNTPQGRHPMFNTLCRHYSANQKCPHGDSCYYAHGEEELTTKYTNMFTHEEPCNNQRCLSKIKFLLQKTSMCPRAANGLCTFGRSCRFAHSEAELRPMPKTEMCIEYRNGNCIHYDNPEKCVYAHSTEELNKKPDSPSEDIDRCLICKRALTYKKSILTCGHDNFHDSCIKEKMKAGIITCPVCNQQTKLSDRRKAF